MEMEPWEGRLCNSYCVLFWMRNSQNLNQWQQLESCRFKDGRQVEMETWRRRFCNLYGKYFLKNIDELENYWVNHIVLRDLGVCRNIAGKRR